VLPCAEVRDHWPAQGLRAAEKALPGSGEGLKAYGGEIPTVISDASCLIDLRKAGLLRALLRLPRTFVIPETLFEAELRSLAKPEKLALRKSGLGSTSG